MTEQNVQALIHDVVTDAEGAINSLLDVVDKGAEFIPKETATVAAQLRGLLVEAKNAIESAGGRNAGP